MTVCRACLSDGGAVQMKTITNDDHQWYELLARVKIKTELQPLSICYLCYSQLKRCRRFSDMVQRSECILTDLRNRRIEVTHEKITAMNLCVSKNLTISHNHHTIYINASKDKEENKEELFLHEETFSDNKEDVINLDSVSKKNIKSTGIEIDFETEQKFIKIEDEIEQQKDYDPNDFSYEEQLNASTCNVCFKTFQFKSKLEKHMRNHSVHVHNDKAVSEKSKLTDNKNHPKKKPHVCKNSYAHKSNLTAHRKTHLRTLNCNQCNKRYRDVTNLNKHMNKHRKSIERPYSCNLCDKKFTDKGHLKEHTRIHSGERPFACSFCPKRFYKRGHLNEHNILHSGEKPHGCLHCGRKFAHKSNLTVHLRLHDKERIVFDCGRCEKTFTQKASLRRHLKTHAGVIGMLNSDIIVATTVCFKTPGIPGLIARFFR